MNSSPVLPNPTVGPEAALKFIEQHLAHLVSGPFTTSPIRGGQRAADAALAAFDVTGYARRRNEVAPPERRGASMLSPYIRHGLLSLSTVWAAVADEPARDVTKFRDELLWQEFARHWYARLGTATRSSLRQDLPVRAERRSWDRSMHCIDTVLEELESNGWLVNQTRMWLASHWTVRNGQAWQTGEDEFFRHLLDGSRAANRLGWQWTTGAGSSKPYGFSRWQVNKRAPGMCANCDLADDCPIEDWPEEMAGTPVERPIALRQAGDVRKIAGPREVVQHNEPDTVWLTAESLGSGDPALAANPALPVIFVFDEPLLSSLRLSVKRMSFLVETLAEVSEAHTLEIVLGKPAEVLAERHVAVTFAPVPGFRRIERRINPVEVHPWPWLRHPTAGSVASFSSWRKSIGRR